MGERVLLLGTTGVDKKTVIENLRQYADLQPGGIKFLDKDFEKDFICASSIELREYLDANPKTQRSLWKEGWNGSVSEGREGFISFFEKNKDGNIFLCLHGVLTGALTGTRCPIHIESLKDLHPTKIITLIDDVYLKWHRTEKRAEGIDYRGRPTLEQLFDARRKEILVSEIITGQIEPIPKHYVVPVRHPARTLFRLLFSKDTTLRTIYLSFPISGPRDLLKKGNDSGIKEVNDFLKAANQFELEHSEVVCFCPLSIDELPLAETFKALKKRETDSTRDTNLTFELKRRWDTREFWGKEIMLVNEKTIPSSIEFFKDQKDQVKDAISFLKADVSRRDYSLVFQSQRIAAFNPWFGGKESKGVRNEIQSAILNNKPVHIYQDPKHDPKNEARQNLNQAAGTLGSRPGDALVKFHNSVEGMFENVLK